MERSQLIKLLEESIGSYYQEYRQDCEEASNKLHNDELLELRFSNVNNLISNKPIISTTQTNVLRKFPGEYRSEGVYLIAATLLSPYVYILLGYKDGILYSL